ncbi:hypothetical protein SERLADRAFT_436555 [Serpula lacrymans var. lacrymans S7.9]|nr:uncharacterized protein SERLADRAFT_436555 [Serpula lacrymans var. lacrymans S7.9]EGO26732.1 hypothetical protein SERLADRAFT_436555 [Serpula lacrymans var. lacrymans S7.9]
MVHSWQTTSQVWHQSPNVPIQRSPPPVILAYNPMAHPLVWPGKYFFYAIGNTSATCLTRDLPPEAPANILLLGCGDARNVLYTIYCDTAHLSRRLDFTCCDIDPAILARNVILLTMVVDNQPCTIIWNIFFHFRLDKDSHSTLVKQCKKLLGLSSTLKDWNASSYGRCIKMCTQYTLKELRRHWSLYVQMQNLPRKRTQSINDAFTRQSQKILRMSGRPCNAARSSGPLMMKATKTMSDQFQNYWKTGVTFTHAQAIDAATIINPTFVYSLAGEGCSVHYGTDPLTPFHLAALFGSANDEVAVEDAVKAAKTEFSDWCFTFLTSTSSASFPVIRFIVGDATVICRALRAFAMTSTCDLDIPLAQWTTQHIELNRDEYISGGAPSTFDVIDTSNIEDHVGLLNILVASVPLLSSAPSSVLYTESLFSHGDGLEKDFRERLYGDITVMGLLLGLCPSDYLSGFTTRYNAQQVGQVTAWKSPSSVDRIASSQDATAPPVFDPSQLGTILYDIYRSMFEKEDSGHFWRLNQGNLAEAVSGSNIIHCTRESFVLFLRLVRDRLGVSDGAWLQVMDRFFVLEDADTSLKMDTLHYQDLCGLLHLHGVYTVPIYHNTVPSTGRFSSWDTVPPLVRIILIIPRERISALKSSLDDAGTPLLQCDIQGKWSQNTFTAVHVSFGNVVSSGSDAHPQVTIEQDPKGWTGSSPLVASFTIPARLLTDIESPDALSVCLSVRSTPAAVLLMSKLGMRLVVFSAKLLDRRQVHVLPGRPVSRVRPASPLPPPYPAVAGVVDSIGLSGAISVELDERRGVVAFLTCRMTVQDEEIKNVLALGAKPLVVQISPCVLRVTVGSGIQDIIYPFPVVGSEHKLRVGSPSYIEVAVPASCSSKPDGIGFDLLPMIQTGECISPWNVHRLDLARLPSLDVYGSKIDQWLQPHIASMASPREKSPRLTCARDALQLLNNTLHTMLVHSSGIQGKSVQRLFAWRDKGAGNRDQGMVFFIDDLKYDLGSHTVVCDGFVLPLNPTISKELAKPLAELTAQGNIENISVSPHEMKIWRQALPAFVERCRSSWKHADHCEYQKSQAKIPPLGNADDADSDPLCHCGRGQDVDGMYKMVLWKPLAPYVTRVALSPLFAVSYVDRTAGEPAAYGGLQRVKVVCSTSLKLAFLGGMLYCLLRAVG